MIPYSRLKVCDLFTLSHSKLLENHTLQNGTYLYGKRLFTTVKHCLASLTLETSVNFHASPTGTTKPNQTKPVLKQARAMTLSSLQNLIYLFIYLCKDSRQGSFLSLDKLLTSSEAPKRRTPEIGIHNCVFTVCGLCKE